MVGDFLVKGRELVLVPLNRFRILHHAFLRLASVSCESAPTFRPGN